MNKKTFFFLFFACCIALPVSFYGWRSLQKVVLVPSESLEESSLGRNPKLSTRETAQSDTTLPFSPEELSNLELGPLSPEEQEVALTAMGITASQFPSGVGQMLLVQNFVTEGYRDATTEEEKRIANNTRMTVLGFANYKNWGTAWGSLNIISAHYDFGMGIEYDVYADREDYKNVQVGNIVNGIVVDDVQGIVSYKLHPFFGVIVKSVAFPFSDRYIAVVYHFREGPENTEETIDELENGTYNGSAREDLKRFDELVSSLKFAQRQ